MRNPARFRLENQDCDDRQKRSSPQSGNWESPNVRIDAAVDRETVACADEAQGFVVGVLNDNQINRINKTDRCDYPSDDLEFHLGGDEAPSLFTRLHPIITTHLPRFQQGAIVHLMAK